MIAFLPRSYSRDSAFDAFTRRISERARERTLVNRAFSSIMPFDTRRMSLPRGAMMPAVSGRALSMRSVMRQSMVRRMMTAPVMEMMPVRKPDTFSATSVFSTAVSLFMRDTSSPVSVASKKGTVRASCFFHSRSRRPATMRCPT